MSNSQGVSEMGRGGKFVDGPNGISESDNGNLGTKMGTQQRRKQEIPGLWNTKRGCGIDENGLHFTVSNLLMAGNTG